MIKSIYATQLEVVSDAGYRLVQLNLEEENTLRILLNEDVVWSADEFEEIVPVIRHAFQFLGQDLEKPQ